MRKLLLPAALLLLAACSGRPAERPALAKKGLPAPQITLPKLLNAPVGELRGWDALEGKVVVLEFWATWCEPCVDYLPKLNLLAERFRGKPVVFLHVTDESEEDVREFLKLNRIDGWIAPEAAAEVFKAFRVYGRPHTVLIGRDGVVAGFPHGDLAPDTVMELLAGQYTPKENQAPALSTGMALAEFYIAVSGARSGTAQYGPASLTASAMPLEYALEWLYGRVDKFDVKPSAAAELAASYDIRFRLPESRAGRKKEFFLQGLESSLGLKVARTEREGEVLVLRKAPGGPLNVKPRRDYGGAELNGAALQVNGGDFGAVAARLKEVLREPVLDETGERGPYEYEFELDSADPKRIDLLLQEQLGLRLVRKLRKLAVVEISKPAK
ncbi:MAG: redoxin domain-containing protein [Elusimicrobiales bacterium]|nr:redoxin domain-containing protein [Elusimicrobiales bacterium]